MAHESRSMIRSSSGAMSREQLIDRALARTRRAAETEAKERAAQENMTQRLLQTGTIFATPALLTFLQVRGMLPPSIMNVPVALAGGVLFRAAAEFMDGGYADVIRNVGDGMLAQYGTVLGSQLAGGVRVGGSVGRAAAVGCGPVGCASPAAYMGAAAYSQPGPQQQFYQQYAAVPAQYGQPAYAGAPGYPFAAPATVGAGPVTDEEIVELTRKYGWS